MKTCKKCNENYEGLKCKPCTAKYMREWSAKNPDKVRKSKQEKYLRNKETIDAKNKDWAEKNREKSNAIKKAWKERNKDKYLAQQREAKKKRYLRDRKYILNQRKTPEAQEVLKKWREKNKERLNAKSLEIYHLSEDKSKFSARSILSKSLKSGKIIKPNKCQVCGSSSKLEAHHNDYKKPLEVIWLCIACHKWIHSKYFKQGGE